MQRDCLAQAHLGMGQTVPRDLGCVLSAWTERTLGQRMMSDMMTYLSTRMAWYRLPELVMAVFVLGSAFAVLVLTAVAHHWRER